MAKNLRKTVFILVAFTGIFFLFFGVNELQYVWNSIPLPENPIDYIESYLLLISLMVLIATTAYGSSIIVEDYNFTGSQMHHFITKANHFQIVKKINF